MTDHAGPRQLRRLLGAVMSVSSDLDLPTVLRHLVEAARDLVGARYAALGVLDPTHTFVAEFITVGMDDEQRALIGALPKGHGILGLLIVDPRPIRLPDLGEHPDSFGFPPGHPPMKSFLGVPLFVRGEAYGNLYLTDKQHEDGFSDTDEELVLGLAAAAALVIDNARLQQRTAELSLLADRERIGRDLHDTAIQCLFATGLAMQGTARIAEHPDVVARLQQHIDDIDSTIRQIRSAIFDMDIVLSPGSGLRRRVLDLVATSARVLGFDPDVRFDGPIDTVVPPNLVAHLLPVLREALSNVARHANATQVEITIRVDNDLSLEVIDNGAGGAREPGGGGNGVRNMARRALELGGYADISPSPNSGMRVHWVVPL
jgi:signal transduction histidine kinase